MRPVTAQRIEIALDSAMLDALLGSPYFHAGFRAFADPQAATLYRLPSTPLLREGDTISWPARGTRARRLRDKPPSLRPFGAWRLYLRDRRRPRRPRPYTVTSRSPMHLELRSPRGAAVKLHVKPSDTIDNAVVLVESTLPTRMTRLLLAYLEAQGRNWQHFLRSGIRPLTLDPHLAWVQQLRHLGDAPSALARSTAEHAGFDTLLLIRHPARIDGRDITWTEVAHANNVTISPSTQWWDLAITDGNAPPQDPYDAHDDRFGTPTDGAEGLAEITPLLQVLADHTSTPEVAFGAIFDTSSLAWHTYGEGPDYSVAYYTTDPNAAVHPQLTIVPASQICSPLVELGRTMHLVQTAITEIPAMATLAEGRAHGIDALWPDSQEWLLLTDIDWPYSILGCNQATAEAVRTAQGIEAVELT